MPVASDVAWQLPLARLLKARYPDMLLSASDADQLLHIASDNDKELAFSYAFADLKHGEAIERSSHAQVKEVRMGRPDTCRVPLTLA